MEEEGDGGGRGCVLVFPLRLCVFAPLRFIPIRVSFRSAFHSDPRFILIRVLQTIDHAVNPVLDEPIPKIDHQPESQVP